MGEPLKSVHSVWDCRWSHLGYRLARVGNDQRPVPDDEPLETLWVCVRQPSSRVVTEEECATCRFWEPNGAPKV